MTKHFVHPKEPKPGSLWFSDAYKTKREEYTSCLVKVLYLKNESRSFGVVKWIVFCEDVYPRKHNGPYSTPYKKKLSIPLHDFLREFRPNTEENESLHLLTVFG